MESIRVQNGVTERIYASALGSGGIPLTGLSNVLLAILRKSDNFYLDFNDNTFKSSGWTTRQIAMTQLSASLSPGDYYYNFNTTGFSDNEYFLRVTCSSAVNMPLEGEIKVGDFVDNIDAAISTRSSHSASDVWAVGTRTLTSFGTLVSDVATAVWAAGTRTLTSFGTLASDVWSVVTRTLTGIGSSGIASETNATTNTNSIISEVNANEAKIDIIDTNVDSILTLVNNLPDENDIALAVWDFEQTGLGRSLTDFDNIVDGVWDEPLSGHLTTGTTGKALSDSGAVSDPDAIAEAVWTFNGTGIGRTLTDFGSLVSDIWSNATRTLTSFGTLVSDIWSNATRTLTGIGSSGIASESNATTNTTSIITEINNNEAKIDIIDTVVDAIKVKTDNLPTDPTSETNATTNTNSIITEVNANETKLDSIISTLSTLAASVATAVWSAGTRTLTSFGTLVSDIWSNVSRTLTGIGSSGIASESNATTNTANIITEVNANETKIDTLTSSLSALTSDIETILALLHENSEVVNQTYDSNGNLLTAIIKHYASATDLENQTGAIRTFELTASYTSNLLTDFQIKRTL